MKTLADKGERIQSFIKRLNSALASNAEVDVATNLLKKMAINDADSEEIKDHLKGCLCLMSAPRLYD